MSIHMSAHMCRLLIDVTDYEAAPDITQIKEPAPRLFFEELPDERCRPPFDPSLPHTLYNNAHSHEPKRARTQSISLLNIWFTYGRIEDYNIDKLERQACMRACIGRTDAWSHMQMQEIDAMVVQEELIADQMDAMWSTKPYVYHDKHDSGPPALNIEFLTF